MRTSGLDTRLRVELLEDQDLVRLLAREVIPAVPLAMQREHVGADMLAEVSPDDIRLQEIIVIDRAPIADRQRPVLDRVLQRPPHTMGPVSTAAGY